MASNYKKTLLSTPAGKSYTLETIFNETATNIEGNYSTIYCEAKLSASNISYSSTNGGKLYIYWHDNRENYDRLVGSSYINSCGMSFGARSVSGTINVYHNNDGNISGYTYAKFERLKTLQYIPYSGGVNTDWTVLTSIPRQAKITNAPNFSDEENPTIRYNNPLGTSATSLHACISLTGEKADIVYREISKTETSYTFNLTEEERKLLRQNTATSNNRQIKFFVRTTIGSNTLYHSVERTLSIVNNNPIFKDFVYEDIGIKSLPITENNQLLIKNFSNIKLTINNKMVAVKESTPKHYVITLDNRIIKVDYSNDPINITIDNISFSGNKRLSVRAYDSRNNSTEVYKDITILDYSKPQIFATISRRNQFEKETTLKINGKYDEVKINGASKNKLINLKYRYKEKGGILSDWFNISINQLNGTYNCDDIILNLDNSKSFEFEIYAEDKLNTEILSIGVGVGIPAFFVSSNKKAIGVNCIPPDDATEGSMWFKGNDGLIKQVLDYDVIKE